MSAAHRSSNRIRVAPAFEREAIGRLRAFLAAHADAFRRSPSFARFYDKFDDDEADRVGALWSCVEALSLGDERSAAAPAEALVRSMPDEDDASGATTVRTFAEALLARVRRSSHGGGNLYTSARPPGAQLRAFELFRQRMPLVPFGWEAATALLCDALARRAPREPPEVTLVDVGIGRGSEVRQLVRQIASRRLARALHVVGVDPDSSSSAALGALELAERAILDAANEVRLPVTFHPVPKVAEELTVADLDAGARGPMVAVCAHSLHHATVHGGHALAGRDAVLRTLRAAGVESLVLVESDSDHFSEALDIRFLFAYRHFRTHARALRARLSPADASVVWSEFFAPQVRNVVAYDGVLRVERHEELARWDERLTSAGFAIDDIEGVCASLAPPPGFDVVLARDGCRVGFAGVPLLGITRARSA